MKLIIDINDNEYAGIKEYPNNITSYPVTIHIYDAIRNGTPLDDVNGKIEFVNMCRDMLDNIGKAESED